MNTINNETTWRDISSAQDTLKNFMTWNIEICNYPETFVELSIHERYCHEHGLEIPLALTQTIKCLAYVLKIPPVITYESLIMMNDLDNNPILFLDTQKDQELLFYKTHLEIEHDLHEIFKISKPLYRWEWINNPEYINSYIVFINDPINRAISRIENLIENFKPEAFNCMRPYFNLNNFPKDKQNWEKYPWPSGAYSAAFVYLDILTGIKWPNEKQYSLDDDMLPQRLWNWYITVKEIEHIKQKVVSQWNLVEKYPNNEYITMLIKNIIKFRGLHMKAAMKFIWKKNMNQPWTGWSNSAIKFLKEHIKNTKNKIDENLITN